MADREGLEARGLIESVRAAFRSWWNPMSREEKARTLWRIWLVFIGLVVLIGGCSMIRRAKHESVNKVGRQWVDTAKQASEENNAQGRSQMPGSAVAPGQPGAGAGGAAQPGGYGQPAQPGRPGTPTQPAAPGMGGAAPGGRGNIPGAGR